MADQQSFSVWEYKPWWCQPWSILLTGTSIVSGSWLLTQRIWIVLIVLFPILVWWTYFLIIYPRLFKQYMMSNSSNR